MVRIDWKKEEWVRRWMEDIYKLVGGGRVWMLGVGFDFERNSELLKDFLIDRKGSCFWI